MGGARAEGRVRGRTGPVGCPLFVGCPLHPCPGCSGAAASQSVLPGLQELSRRCETLIRLIEKENEDDDTLAAAKKRAGGGKKKKEGTGGRAGGSQSPAGRGASAGIVGLAGSFYPAPQAEPPACERRCGCWEWQ